MKNNHIKILITTLLASPGALSMEAPPSQESLATLIMLAQTACQETESREKLKASHRKNKNTCPKPHCGKQFTCQTSLKRHLIIHAETKPYCCHQEDCHKSFSDRAGRNRHEIEVPHPCDSSPAAAGDEPDTRKIHFICRHEQE